MYVTEIPVAKEPTRILLELSTANGGPLAVKDAKNDTVLLRNVPPGQTKVSLNMPEAQAGTHKIYSSDPIKALKKDKFEDYKFFVWIPENHPKRKNRPFTLFDLRTVYDPTLYNGIAKINITPELGGKISHGPQFWTFPRQWRIFLFLHEMGHYYFTDEHLADEFAIHNFIGMGFGLSQAYNALACVLHNSPGNKFRLENAYSILSNYYNYERQ